MNINFFLRIVVIIAVIIVALLVAKIIYALNIPEWLKIYLISH